MVLASLETPDSDGQTLHNSSQVMPCCTELLWQDDVSPFLSSTGGFLNPEQIFMDSALALRSFGIPSTSPPGMGSSWESAVAVSQN